MMPDPQHADLERSMQVARKQIASLRETPPLQAGNRSEMIGAPHQGNGETAETRTFA